MLYLTIIGGAFIVWLILVVLFTPHIPYHVEGDIDARSAHFVQVLESTLQTTMTRGNRMEVFTNGTRSIRRCSTAIRGAQETVNLECYIFKDGEIGRQFIEALSDRARHGVRVTDRLRRDWQSRRLPSCQSSAARRGLPRRTLSAHDAGIAWVG